jgi:hypothetical protein
VSTDPLSVLVGGGACCNGLSPAGRSFFSLSRMNDEVCMKLVLP